MHCAQECLRVADVGVFRPEESRQQRVDAQQAVAGQRDRLGVGLREVALVLQRV